VTARILEALFRNRLLILAPVVLVPLVAIVFTLGAAAPYESSAGIWTDRAAYLNVPSDISPYINPSQSQANRLHELLRSRAFVADVVRRTSLAPLLETPEGREEVQRLLADAIDAAPLGEHLLAVRYRAASPQLALEGVTAVVAAFRSRTTADRLGQAGIALAFYEGRLKDADTATSKANDALSVYVGSTPSLRGPNGFLSPTASLDPRFLDLQRAADSAAANADRLRSLLYQAQLDVAATQAGQDVGFRVVDQPQLPTEATRQLRKILIYPVAAFAGGLLLGTLLLLLLVVGDRSIRRATELPNAAAVVGVLARLVPNDIGAPREPALVRRAIGYVAGSALGVGAGGRLRS